MSSPKKDWYRDNYLISTSPKLIQSAAVSIAFASDLMYWTNSMEESLLKKTLDNSLCFGVYELPSSTSDIAGRGNPRQIGLARLITDHVTFGYLTDVYILKEYQGKGLGTWLMECVDETLTQWPMLRRVLLMTSNGTKFYSDKLHMKELEPRKNGLSILSRNGAGSVFKD